MINQDLKKILSQTGSKEPPPVENKYARVAELVDALDLGSSSGDRVGVQVSPLAPFCN